MLIAEPALSAEQLAAIRAPFAAFGGTRVDAPVLQPLSLLLDLAGEGLRARLFVVQSESAEEQALRPDFTIPVVQSHIASGAGTGGYVYEGKAFLAPERGSDQASEFLQIGAELFGPGGDPYADDARIAALAWSAAVAGGRTDLSLLLGDPGLFRGFLQAMGLASSVALRLQRALSSPGPWPWPWGASLPPTTAAMPGWRTCCPASAKPTPRPCWRRSGACPPSSPWVAGPRRRSCIASPPGRTPRGRLA